MRPFDDPARLSSDARLTELASIFASAILRLRARAALATKSDPNAGPACLEVPAETVLSDHDG